MLIKAIEAVCDLEEETKKIQLLLVTAVVEF